LRIVGCPRPDDAGEAASDTFEHRTGHGARESALTRALDDLFKRPLRQILARAQLGQRPIWRAIHRAARGRTPEPRRHSRGGALDEPRRLTIKKAGSVGTMVSLWLLLPERRTGVGFLFNREDYQVLPLVANVVRILSGLDAEPFPAGSPPSFTAPAPAAISPAARAAWVGRYDTRFGTVRVFLHGDSLLAHHEGLEAALVPRDDSSFVLVSDIVAHAGKVLSFRRRGGRVAVWLDADSIGVADAAR
jgi:hypothetical protein